MFGFGRKKKKAVHTENETNEDIVDAKVLKRKRYEDEASMKPSDVIPPGQMDKLRDNLIQSHAPLVIRGMLDLESRQKLEKIIREEHRMDTRGREDLVQYITRETVGTGVIEDILANDPTITDIGYNGSDLIVESNDRKYIYNTTHGIDGTYIIRLVNKFAYANKDSFTEKTPIFDGKFDNIRVNAMYGSNTANQAVTMSLRIVRPQLMLTKESFFTFAPQYIYDMFEVMTKMKSNIVISGETGTGKTELQKMLASFIPFNQRVVLIEDVAETFLKEMFDEKDIYSWVTSPDVSITDLVKASLRNNPRWILVSETRGQEAYEMIQAVLSGHHIITTLHAVNAEAIPTRLVNMAKMGYTFDEHGLTQDILRYFDFGVHIIRDTHEGKTLRYLNELIYFDENESTTIFRQDFVNGEFICQINELPDSWYRKFSRNNSLPKEFKEHTAHKRIATVKKSMNDNGVEQLDLSIKDGRAMTLDEVAAVLPEEHIVMNRARRTIDNDKVLKKRAKTKEIEPFVPTTSPTQSDDIPMIDLSQPRGKAFIAESVVEKSAKEVAHERLDKMKSNRVPAAPKVKAKQVRTSQAVQSEAEALLNQYKKTAGAQAKKKRPEKVGTK